MCERERPLRSLWLWQCTLRMQYVLNEYSVRHKEAFWAPRPAAGCGRGRATSWTKIMATNSGHSTRSTFGVTPRINKRKHGHEGCLLASQDHFLTVKWQRSRPSRPLSGAAGPSCPFFAGSHCPQCCNMSVLEVQDCIRKGKRSAYLQTISMCVCVC